MNSPLCGAKSWQLRRSIRELCQQQGVELVEGHAMPEHVHLCLSMPPKFSVANTVNWLRVSKRA